MLKAWPRSLKKKGDNSEETKKRNEKKKKKGKRWLSERLIFIPEELL